MFGNYSRKFDDKNRVLVPSKLRNKIGIVCYITQDLENILVIRDAESFAAWSKKLMSLNSLNDKARKLARILLGRTYEVELDKQGRISFQAEAIKNTGLTREIVFVGVGDKIEIHSKANFDKIQEEASKAESLDDLALELMQNGANL